MTQHPSPPPTLETCRVIEYAIFSDPPAPGPTFFSGNKQVGPPTFLAICGSATKSVVFLFYCDKDWSTLGSKQCSSLDEAKAYIQHSYPETTVTWIEAHFSEQDAANHLEKLWGPQRCNFCGKTPLDFENPRFIQQNGAVICESCVTACYELLHGDDEETHTQPS